MHECELVHSCFGFYYSRYGRENARVSNTQNSAASFLSTSSYQAGPHHFVPLPSIHSPLSVLKDKHAIMRTKRAICKVPDSETWMRDDAMPLNARLLLPEWKPC